MEILTESQRGFHGKGLQENPGKPKKNQEKPRENKERRKVSGSGEKYTTQPCHCYQPRALQLSSKPNVNREITRLVLHKFSILCTCMFLISITSVLLYPCAWGPPLSGVYRPVALARGIHDNGFPIGSCLRSGFT